MAITSYVTHSKKKKERKEEKKVQAEGAVEVGGGLRVRRGREGSLSAASTREQGGR